jgi:hypothetical protein
MPHIGLLVAARPLSRNRLGFLMVRQQAEVSTLEDCCHWCLLKSRRNMHSLHDGWPGGEPLIGQEASVFKAGGHAAVRRVTEARRSAGLLCMTSGYVELKECEVEYGRK